MKKRASTGIKLDPSLLTFSVWNWNWNFNGWRILNGNGNGTTRNLLEEAFSKERKALPRRLHSSSSLSQHQWSHYESTQSGSIPFHSFYLHSPNLIFKFNFLVIFSSQVIRIHGFKKIHHAPKVRTISLIFKFNCLIEFRISVVVVVVIVSRTEFIYFLMLLLIC